MCLGKWKIENHLCVNIRSFVCGDWDASCVKSGVYVRGDGHLNTHLSLGADGGSPFQHHVHYLFMSRPGSAVEGCEAVPCFGLNVSSLL